jgi:POT family proton-dependent oligopeptide transporter
MAKTPYRASPDQNETGWPKGISNIIGNEGCERFSYYGMTSILYVYVVSLYSGMSFSAEQAANSATSVVHFFTTGVYALPMVGAIVADRLLGKYNTIVLLSLVYCLGHLVLSLSEGSVAGLYAGLALIAIGSGGIKPCVSAHVGDQFGRANWGRIERVYQIFYFMVNFGSLFAAMLIPLFQKWFGWSVAFAIPGILMFIATIWFWMGRNRFVHVPASPGGTLGFLDMLSSVFLFMTVGSLFVTATYDLATIALVSASCLALGIAFFQIRQSRKADNGFLAISVAATKEALVRLWFSPAVVPAPSTVSMMQGQGPSVHGSPTLTKSIVQSLKERYGDEPVEGAKAVVRIFSVFFMVSIFWALFDQHASSWIRQAEMLDRSIWLPLVGSVEVLASQVPALNPILVLILIPTLAYVITPRIERLGFKTTPLRRMTVGMCLASLAFVSVAILQSKIDGAATLGTKIHVAWQIIPYALMTLAEVLVSVTGLEFAYTQAPPRMKSTVMGFWLLTVAVGNVLVALLARFSNLALVDFFWLFAALMAVAAILFALRAAAYTTRDYPQQSDA